MNPARALAVRSLIAIDKNRRYSNLELDAQLKSTSFSAQDRRLYTALVYGVVERKLTLDHILGRCSGRAADKIDPYLAAILRISLYQMFYMDKIPAHAILNEGSELAKLRFGQRGADFVSGVLHRALRAIEANEDLFSDLTSLERSSAQFSIPVWMLSLWADAYGSDRANAIADAFQAQVLPTLFVNLKKCSVDKLLSVFAENGVAANKLPGSLPLVQLTEPVGDLKKLVNFDLGWFFVQDRSSAQAVAAIDPKAGESIIDLCAAPGGKSFAAAILSEDLASIRASDLHENKLSLIRSGAERLGLSSISVFCRDARRSIPEEHLCYDKVICDVPCSGLGVLAKKPDLRHKDPKEIERLPQIQHEILCAGAALLKPGGLLLYSTCTLNPHENEHVLERFLKEHPDYRYQTAPVTLFPESGVSDGFFYGVLTRT